MSSLTEVVLLAVLMNTVPVYGEPTHLNATEGNKITLPDRLMGSDVTLTFGGTTRLMVSNGVVIHRSDARLLWNKSTGEITITDLQESDSGKLVVNTRNSPPRVYILTVCAAALTPTTTPTTTPAVNQLLWLHLCWLFPLLFFVGLGYYFCVHRRTARQRRTEGGSAAGSGQTANRNMENHHMMPPDDDAAEKPVELEERS